MSSSPRVTRLSSPVFEVGISPSPLGTADAALVSDNDNPAAPNTGRALLRCFSFEVCFAWGIMNSFHTTGGPHFSERRQQLCGKAITSRRRYSKPISAENFFRSFLIKPVILDRRGLGQKACELDSEAGENGSVITKTEREAALASISPLAPTCYDKLPTKI